jgi:hypothetical protein
VIEQIMRPLTFGESARYLATLTGRRFDARDIQHAVARGELRSTIWNRAPRISVVDLKKFLTMITRSASIVLP